MSYPLLEIQQALYGVLNGDATLQNLVNGIYDQAPEDAVYPFIAFEDVRAEDWPFQGGEGVRAEIELVAYSRYNGKGELYSILARMHHLLHDEVINATGIQIVQTRITQSRVESLNDGRTQRGRMQIEMIVHD